MTALRHQLQLVGRGDLTTAAALGVAAATDKLFASGSWARRPPRRAGANTTRRICDERRHQCRSHN
jgi:hypothetical protein